MSTRCVDTQTWTVADRPVVARSPTEDPRRTDGVPEVGDVLQHREVEIDVVVWREEGQMGWAHAGCVEICLERWGGGGGCSRHQRDRDHRCS
jgi:hypothetical protein